MQYTRSKKKAPGMGQGKKVPCYIECQMTARAAQDACQLCLSKSDQSSPPMGVVCLKKNYILPLKS